MTQHTQGPWDLQGTLISHGEGRPLARVWNEHENWEANARVMTAAPELLEALEESNEQLKMLYDYAKYMRRIVMANLKEAEAIKATYIALDDLDDVMLCGQINEKAIAKARG